MVAPGWLVSGPSNEIAVRVRVVFMRMSMWCSDSEFVLDGTFERSAVYSKGTGLGESDRRIDMVLLTKDWLIDQRSAG